MVFKSIDEMRRYTLRIMDDCATLTAQEMVDIMKRKIEEAYRSYSPKMYVRTMDLMNTPQEVMANNKKIVTEFMDNGGWYSLVGRTQGQHFFALEGLEGGYSWGRGATNIYEEAKQDCFTDGVQYYKECMKAFGVPLK